MTDERDELARDLSAADADTWEKMADNLLAAGYRKVGPVAETRTEWGVRRAPKYGSTVVWMDSRASAESLARSWEDSAVVSRTVTAGHWTAPEETTDAH